MFFLQRAWMSKDSKWKPCDKASLFISTSYSKGLLMAESIDALNRFIIVS